MRFREHRGGLAESLETTVDVSDAGELASHVKKILAPWGVAVDALKVEPYGGDDDRIGWKDVHVVTAAGYGVVGFVERGRR